MAVEDSIRRELSRGTLELAVLAMVAQGPRYGYDLLSSLRKASGGFPEVKEGTLYPVLHRLEDAGYIAAEWEAEGRAAPRKYYKLTKAGRARLETLKAEWQRLVEGMTRVLKGGQK